MIGESKGGMDAIGPVIKMVEGERADAQKQRDAGLGFGKVGWASNKKSMLPAAQAVEKRAIPDSHAYANTGGVKPKTVQPQASRPDDYTAHDKPKPKVNMAL